MRGADTLKTKRSRKLRRQQSDAESRLWFQLRDRRLCGYKFRRQYPVGPYFADFACVERRLIIELDGGQHTQQATADERRTRHLQEQGYTVLRFWNDQVLREMDVVLAEILRLLRAD